MFKITFELYSPVSYIDLPVFDSILAYCLYSSQQKITNYHTPTGKEVRNSTLKTDIPLIKHELGFYLASYMCCNEIIEGVDSWKKRWENNHDRIVNFGRSKRRVTTGMGETKSYNMPVQINITNKVWFYFDTSNIKRLEKLLKNNLYGIGKKVKMGFGFFRNFNIENSKEEDMLFFRPLPQTALKIALEKFGNIKQTFGSYKIPYWLPQNQQKIIIPKLRNNP
jgi:hypothetical protein